MATLNVLTAMAGLSPHTQRAYRRWIMRYLGAGVNLVALPSKTVKQALRPDVLKTWFGTLKTGGLGAQSLGQAKAAIVWLAQACADAGALDYFTPAALSRVKVPRAEKGQRPGQWLNPDQVSALLNAPLDTHKPAGQARNRLILLFLVVLGLRRHELIAARWSDLSRMNGQAIISIHGKGDKRRIVKLPEVVNQALDNWRVYHPDPTGDSPIFIRVINGGKGQVEPIDDKNIGYLVKSAARAAGLPPVSPHDLRRSFARNAYEAGASFDLIKQALGHANVTTTEHYVNSVLELDRAASDFVADMIR